MKQVLFICTGNFYRSRFAEAVFNYSAISSGLEWKAVSRGLAIHLASGDLSSHIDRALKELQIPRVCTAPTRQSLTELDLSSSQKIIGMQRHEHYPLMLGQFPAWADKIEYWDVADADFLSPKLALKLVERCVADLIESLREEKSS